MSPTEKNMLDYIVACVSEFASHYDMHMKDAYRYLRKYKGIDFLMQYYDAEHTLSFEDAVEDLTAICKRNGGNVA